MKVLRPRKEHKKSCRICGEENKGQSDVAFNEHRGFEHSGAFN
jgi:hypothetical protein